MIGELLTTNTFRVEITHEECLRIRGGMVGSSKLQILEEIDQITKFRLGFDILAEYCQTHHYSLVVVSAGLDFVIKHLLTRENLMDKVELFAAAAKCTPTGIKFNFVKLKDNRSISFKDDTARYWETKAESVAFIGDGRWDLRP